MAYDKIVDSVALDAIFTDIANAIRGKTGDTAVIAYDAMAAAIAAIEAGVDFGRKVAWGTITPAEDISSDYKITHEPVPSDLTNGIYPTVYLFKDAEYSTVPYSWIWLVMGYDVARSGFTHGEYYSSSGSKISAKSFAEIGSVTSLKSFTISCDPTKMLMAGHTYFWIRIQNSKFS